MSANVLPNLIHEDLFRFKAGDRFVFPLAPLTPDAPVLAEMARTCREKGEKLLILCADAMDVTRLSQEITWFDKDANVLALPDWETLPYDVLSPQEELVSERLETLYRITTATDKANVVSASALTASQRMAPVSYVGANTFFFKTGETLSTDNLRENLVKAGYANVKQVLAPT